jgi:hypothetical protein
MKWKQRANENWLKNDDRNTKYFHTCANFRNRRNLISRILDGNGQLCSNQRDIEQAFIQYYTALYTSSIPQDFEPCVQAITSKVTGPMNQLLLAEFTGANKAPGPDGFFVDFFQQNWPTIHIEVCNASLHFLHTGMMDPFINVTNIALIPKSKNPVGVADFRSISLCNVLYKIASKVLANKLKEMLPFIISLYQSAFIPDRLITNNILATTLHSVHTNMWSKVGFMGIKLDMSKAYDRVEWLFLEAVMRRLGFSNRRIQLIMALVSTVTYAILINGQAVGTIYPTRGLCQGDPLSPYLFFLCPEALSSILQQVELKESITGVSTSKHELRLSHRCFADDSLLFSKANFVEWWRLMRIFDRYKAALGQKLNMTKTSIFFNRNTSATKRLEITQLSGLQATQQYNKYLGLPVVTTHVFLYNIQNGSSQWHNYLSQSQHVVHIP